MRLGIVGRGYWGDTYARTLQKLGIDYWQAGRDWGDKADGIIVACCSEAHYDVARACLLRRTPVLIEKPVCTRSQDVEALIALGGIAFAAHTRLYSPAWREFKAKIGKPKAVTGFAGGVNDTNPDADWNWLIHLAAMSLDLGFCPEKAMFHVSEQRQPLRLLVDQHEFLDQITQPTPLEVLVTEFCDAIRKKQPNNDGLKLGLQAVRYVENKTCPWPTTPRSK